MRRHAEESRPVLKKPARAQHVVRQPDLIRSILQSRAHQVVDARGRLRRNEHAYHMDYGAKAGAYVDAFMEAINWDNAVKLYDRVSREG